MPPMFLSEDELLKMVFAATNRRPYTPPHTYARKVFEQIQTEVDAIRAVGGIVDISAPLPG